MTEEGVAGGPAARREDGSEAWRKWKRRQMTPHHGINGWQCQNPDCGYVLLTIDVDPGTTPAMLACRWPYGCTGTMTTFGYPSEPVPAILGEPVMEWYWPRKGSPEYAALDDLEQEHVDRGGLVLRDRTDARSAYSPIVLG